MVANGDKLTSIGYCKEVTLSIQGVPVFTDLYLLKLEGCEVVLGAHWLRTLGPVLWDFSNLWMQFTWKGSTCQLKGEPINDPSPLKPPKLSKTVKGKGVLLQLCNILTFVHPPVNPQIEELLLENEEIFEEPKGLPPRQTHDHKIPLIKGSTPVSVRPYRYLHYQKNEIEKMVKDMLCSGIVRPSQSPFSSTVLLVQKNDRSWPFCVDYRGLNQVTIKDKFPFSDN